MSPQDPFAKYGGSAIEDEDPFKKYGGSAVATATPASPGTTTQGPAAEAAKRAQRRADFEKFMQTQGMQAATTFAKGINPLAAAPELYEDYSRRKAAEEGRGAWFPRLSAAFDTLGDIHRSMMGAPIQQLEKAGEALQTRAPHETLGERAGRYSEALGHAGAAVVPLIGPAAAETGEQLGAGQYGKAAGGAAALMLPSALEASAAIAPGEIRPRLFSSSQLNPVEQRAVNFGEQAGIPMDLATRTGGRASRVYQKIAGETPLGSLIGGAARRNQETALAQELENLKQTVGQQRLGTQAFTPQSAGEAVAGRVQGRIANLDSAADRAYGQLRQIEQDPANIQNVTLGQQQMPVTTPGRGVTGMQTVPIQKQIAIPVDMRGVKKALQPIYQDMLKTMPIAQQQASPGLKAIENILQGDDVIAASAAERNLSALKGITRKADSPLLRNVSQGLAARSIRELEDTVQGAVATAGPDAVQALNRGRALTKAKYAAADLLDRVQGTQGEPVGIYNKLTRNQDQGINLLNEVRQVAPQEMPKLGRAVLQELIDKATAEGGFRRAAGLQADWTRLGPQTKKLLFPDAGVRANLDNFFLLAKRMAENPNPSGTGSVITGLEVLRDIGAHPVLGSLAVMGSGAASGLMMTDAGSRMLVDGLRVPVKGPLQAAATVARINRLLANLPTPPAQAPGPPPPGSAAPAPAERQSPVRPAF